MRAYLIVFLLLAGLAPSVRGFAPAPLAVAVTLTHVAPDTWRADYAFAEPVDGLALGPPVGTLRRQSWQVLTPGAALVEQDGGEAVRLDQPRAALSVEIRLDTDYQQGSYTAFDRFSDGGTDVYLGYLRGDAMQAGAARPLRQTLSLAGLPGETTIAPDGGADAPAGYAYFGPRTPVDAGAARLILDPRAPAWMAPVLVDTTAAISSLYERAFGRRLGYRPLLLVSIGDLDPPGLATKGGVVGRQIVYRFGGKALAGGSPAVRLRCMETIAHEMAHIWQTSVARGGIGETEGWIHEGGAEAIALAGLRQSGLFSAVEADAYAARLLKECEALGGAVDSYRGMYACGYARFAADGRDIFALWKAMMAASEAGGAVYSSAMIEALRRP